MNSTNGAASACSSASASLVGYAVRTFQHSMVRTAYPTWLLFSVPSEQAQECLNVLHQNGVAKACVIGEVIDRREIVVNEAVSID